MGERADERTSWVLRRVSTIFAVRKEKLEKFLQLFGEDTSSSRVLDTFLNEVEVPAVFFHLSTNADSCTTSTDLPTAAQMKKKVLALVRSKHEAEIDISLPQRPVVFIELGKGIMDLINSYCHSVYLSVLMNPANQRGWSDLISRDLIDKFHSFLATLHVTVGLMKGQTLLPLPPREAAQDSGDKSKTTSSISKDRVHVLEGAVITWTKQVRYVLKQEPEHVFREGNPQPDAELKFWQNRASNLNSIQNQLQMEGVKRVLRFLEANKSTYVSPFARLQKEVEDSREEANDNVRFLKTLEPYVNNLLSESADFEALEQVFDDIFHLLLLIWRHSKYYNSLARLAVIVRQVCNSLIAQATRYISGSSVFEMIQNEAHECHAMLETVMRALRSLQDAYHTYQNLSEQGSSSAAVLTKSDATGVMGSGWRLRNNVVFGRLEAFGERVSDILDFVKTVLQFHKLERVDIGGTKGKVLSMSVEKVHEEFEKAVDKFRRVPYDIFDVKEAAFIEDFHDFRLTIRDLDRRLGSVLAAAFHDQNTLHGRSKLLDAFEGLLERPVIQAELVRKQKVLIDQYRLDVDQIHANFTANEEKVDHCDADAPIFANLPPVAGAIFWARSLRTRLQEPMPKILAYNELMREVPESFKELLRIHDQTLQTLDEYEKRRYSEWKQEAVEEAAKRLHMRLLRRHDRTGLLKVNFDPALVRLLREVRFFLIYGMEVPPEALTIYNMVDTYRTWTSQLDHIVGLYNSVLTDLLPVEEPLLEDRILKMDNALAPGLTELKWSREDQIPDFIAEAMKVVSDVSAIVDIMKGNLRKISNILSQWCKDSMLERKRGAKPVSVEEFEQNHKARVGVCLMNMTDGGKEIHRFVKDSSESLKISKTAPTWKAYVDFVNNVVIEGFVSAIAVSLQYLCEILDPLIIARHEMLPLFDVKIELQGDEIVFDPPFEDEENPSRTTLRSTIDSWLKDFFAMATVMVRLDSNVGDYLNEIKEHFQMQCLLSLVSELIDNTEAKCVEYRETFMTHSFLWTDSVEKTFERFLQDNPKELVNFQEGGMSFRDIMIRIKVDLGPPIPALERFDKEVARFEHLKQELSLKKTPTDIHWLRIDAQPVKVTLVNCARKWEEKFTGFLRRFVEDRITSVSAFIESVRTGLGPPFAADRPEDERLLYLTMTKIRDVKLARGAIQRLFQPLREQVQMLKKHHSSISEESWNILEHAPAHWAEVDRSAFNEKEKILPLQNQEMQKIRVKIEGFREDVRSFRAEFLERCPFGSEHAVTGNYDKSYALINEYYGKTMEIRARAEEFNDLELLFDMAMSDYRPLNDCLNNLVLLKNLWDLIVMVRETFSAWYNVLWDKIDTGQMVETVRELSNQVHRAQKGLRAWPLYSWLQDEVKNMSAALPLVNELHSETMRDRHWATLMGVTKKTFDKGPEFSFRHLLELELHHFSDDVYDIVDQSVKESKIEAKLEGIRKTWSKMTVDFDNNREDCPLLADLSEVLERLESDSLEMLSMTSQGRFIEFCKQTVDEWSEKLQTVDSVLQVWRKFQTNWCRLEPIFMQSDDIRSQLPEDSKRFEMLDNSWKDLMMEASRSSLIVEICTADGRAQTLEDITDALDTCERSLNDYLEQKKKAFPRFYFVANGALLDILSNGNTPLKVAEYLGDVFDGIRTLDFSKDPVMGRVACGHCAKDGEFVPWPADPGSFVLEGPVEQYLAGLESHIRLALREILEQARTSAESWELGDRPRETWLDDYCAQLSLLATQVIWTEETTRAFEDMEAGSETAMRDYKRVNDDRIDKLIRRVQRESNKELRTKVITIITIDVHSRDVIESFVLQKVNEANDFRWGSQLRFYWTVYPPGSTLVSFTPPQQKTCLIKICDWATCYAYEYIGNVGRLVITPLTDRCYITLTQALNLCLGGAPAGPAGTGKTETTKDLSRALGLPIVVFNCSDQMTYQTTAQIFMGLAQVGAWGCFDEFNRISIEVLSVVSTQYKSVLDAIRANSKTFLFVDEELRLVKTVGAFITMNPGYAGRTELPENLKALFRSVAMIVPNLKFICENMLMSEGFTNARLLAHKFVTLYSLSKELLSKQMHYDWGLRAVKSLLRQAGDLKAKEDTEDESVVLCRALRDFNLPKITTQDMPIFSRLIKDLFPNVKATPFVDPHFRQVCEDTVKGRGLQTDPGFIDKVVDFLDILKVRHCCFIIGPTGAGKTEIWRSLEMTLIAIGEDCRWEQVNPKAITADELYGTNFKGEWKDGAISVIMRNMSKEINGYKSTHLHKWVVLDGDIDATWIESMNTVMDDNKVLTLVSNERIPFTPTMRMLLEIQDMKHASPATVSRGGVLYINETDVGWKPFVESWREQMDPVAQSTFYMLFTHQFEGNIEQLRKNFAFTCPILDMGFVQTVTCLLDALLMTDPGTATGRDAEGKHTTLEYLRSMTTEEQKVIYESFFTFALMWTLGGAVADDKIVNHRKAFSATLRSMARGVKLPEVGECFDFHFEVQTKEWVHWEKRVKPYEPLTEVLYQNIVISNVELERMKHLLGLHVKRQKPLLLVGVAGTAKATIVKDYLAEVKANSDAMNSASINLNSYTTSGALQNIIVGCLKKRSGHTYGPPGHRRCIFFVDDLNMPYVDDYDTQSAIMLLTQVLSYGQVYDRERLDEKKNIVDLLFTACMNPKAGSFMINGRLQRRFTVATTYSATAVALHGIYTRILGRHLQGFGQQTQRCCEPIVNATAEILSLIQNSPAFLPSAEKFHYQFNLKDISNLFQGLLSTNGSVFRDSAGPSRFLRVWLHECYRVFSDRLVLESDAKELQSMIEKAVSRSFVGVGAASNREELFALPLCCTSFISEASGPDRHYLPARDMQQIRDVVEARLAAYNNEHATMNLVLFDDAVFHVCRICRITQNPCGSALLVGVGGSGKQSLARLSSFINGQEVQTILVNQQYGLNELKCDLQEFYKKAAVKPATPQAFLLTDSQITDERFLVSINDMLSSGNIPDLFAREEYDNIFSSIRNAAKFANYADDRESLFQFFLDKVRSNLHLIFCHSPVGSTFRIRGRKFPALISCMVLDVFHPWPRDALVGVAQRFMVVLSQNNIQDEETLASIAHHSAEVHVSVYQANRRYLEEERRYNSTTPKSFLELINFYVQMLTEKQASVDFNVSRLERGLAIMHDVQEGVADLKRDLQITLQQVDEKKISTEELIKQVTVAQAAATVEREAARQEQSKCEALAAEAQRMKTEADNELQEALPAMEKAKAAVDCLDKASITELKTFGKPAQECIDVVAACGFLLKHEKRKLDWKGCQLMMKSPQQFIDDVKSFDADNIPEQVLMNTEPLIGQLNFESMKSKSLAAAHLTNWVVNIVTYNKIYTKVAPLIEKVRVAQETTESAKLQLREVEKRVEAVEADCAELDQQLTDAFTEKETMERQAASCVSKLNTAQRLVSGLADENERWANTVVDLRDLSLRLIGNCMLASAFVGYASPFSARLRQDLWQQVWTADLKQREIPMTNGIDPLTVLASDADVAGWMNEGLPADRVSVENASVVTSCSRWPLLVDPQQQGARWIKQRIGEELTVIQLSNSKWLDKVIFCVQTGSQLLIEALQDEIDAILEPLLSRAVIKRGRGPMFLKLGPDEIEYDSKFQLYLQSKLPNPHFRPEVSAQCTVVNFIVTPEGLEEQILALVVNCEKPQLEEEKQILVRRQNEFKVILSRLEDELLSQLSAADPDTILDNIPLIEGLEKTKHTSREIALQVAEAEKTEVEINHSRELYRSVASEGSMLFFLVVELSTVQHMYQYSLDAFNTFLQKAIDRTQETDDVKERTERLIASIRLTIFRWVNRGLFEDHKLIFCCMLSFRLLQLRLLQEDYVPAHFHFLLRGPQVPHIGENPLADWLPDKSWAMVLKLVELEGFENFAQNMERDAPNRFRDWVAEQAPEEAKLPLDWKALDAKYFRKLLVIRCLRPDRMSSALAKWIRQSLPNGRAFIDCDASLSFYKVLSSSFEDSTSTTPFFFILSPGADPVKEVEALGKTMIGLQANVNYHNVAMGQGQDEIAMQKLELGSKEGHWVMLQNIHLMPSWCAILEKRLDAFAVENSNPYFRLFLSADPSPGIPIGLLERSIKLTNEPPQGLLANLRRSFALFNREEFDERDSKIKSILFALCHFHSLMLERKKFGPLGYNMKYPFSSGDLRDSASVLYNYLEGSTAVKIPWEDLRYIFGEIMYGGHIVDDWDRRMCGKYLSYFMQDDILDEMELVPYAEGLSWKSPGPGTHEKYLEHIETMPPESPLFFGMHPNAEIDFRTKMCANIFELLQSMQPKQAPGQGTGEQDVFATNHAEEMCNEILDEVREVRFNVEEAAMNLTEEEKGPYPFVLLQECECMNCLVREMVRGLNELQQGFKGELTMSEHMEQLADALTEESLPVWWVKLGFPSTRPLRSWLVNLKDRCAQLDDWFPDPPAVPKVVDVSKLFNPQSFLTAIKQVCCQNQKLELDRLHVFTEVTKRIDTKSVDIGAKEGAYVTGMYLEGARWDANTNCLEDSRPKEMFTRLPVINCKAGLQQEREDKNVYLCPTYCVPTRRPHFVFVAQLRTKQPAAKWVLAGVAIILDIGS